MKREGQPDLPEKCTRVTRLLVFLKPDRFVVFDRVTTTAPGYRKDWLLHTAHEPVLTDHTFRADQDGGRMFCRTLLPADATIQKVGGPGKEFQAAGENWKLVDRGLTPENKAMMGQWRVEVSPGTARQEDLFLHVIQVGDRQLGQMDGAELVQEGTWRGVRLACGGRAVAVTFDTTGDLKMHIH